MLVFPGWAVPPRLNSEMPTALTMTSDTWETGSKAAAFGGTTTVIDFVESRYPKQPLLIFFWERRSQAQGRSAIDFGLHMTLCESDTETLQQIAEVVAAGMPSFKMYTTYTGFHLSDEEMLAAFEKSRMRKVWRWCMPSKCHHSAGGSSVARCRAVECQVFSFEPAGGRRKKGGGTVLNLSDYAGAPVYIVHVSTRSAADAIARARQKGQAAWGETCLQYLLLDENCVQTKDF